MDTEFAYWVPNISGGLVVSDWETETDWTYDYNLDLARTAEAVGFDYALAQALYLTQFDFLVLRQIPLFHSDYYE